MVLLFIIVMSFDEITANKDAGTDLFFWRL